MVSVGDRGGWREGDVGGKRGVGVLGGGGMPQEKWGVSCRALPWEREGPGSTFLVNLLAPPKNHIITLPHPPEITGSRRWMTSM